MLSLIYLQEALDREGLDYAPGMDFLQVNKVGANDVDELHRRHSSISISMILGARKFNFALPVAREISDEFPLTDEDSVKGDHDSYQMQDVRVMRLPM